MLLWLWRSAGSYPSFLGRWPPIPPSQPWPPSQPRGTSLHQSAPFTTLPEEHAGELEGPLFK